MGIGLGNFVAINKLCPLTGRSANRYVKKSWRIGCVIPHCKLQCGITQPILKLFGHICTYQVRDRCRQKGGSQLPLGGVHAVHHEEWQRRLQHPHPHVGKSYGSWERFAEYKKMNSRNLWIPFLFPHLHLPDAHKMYGSLMRAFSVGASSSLLRTAGCKTSSWRPEKISVTRCFLFGRFSETWCQMSAVSIHDNIWPNFFCHILYQTHALHLHPATSFMGWTASETVPMSELLSWKPLLGWIKNFSYF